MHFPSSSESDTGSLITAESLVRDQSADNPHKGRLSLPFKTLRRRTSSSSFLSAVLHPHPDPPSPSHKPRVLYKPHPPLPQHPASENHPIPPATPEEGADEDLSSTPKRKRRLSFFRRTSSGRHSYHGLSIHEGIPAVPPVPVDHSAASSPSPPSSSLFRFPSHALSSPTLDSHSLILVTSRSITSSPSKHSIPPTPPLTPPLPPLAWNKPPPPSPLVHPTELPPLPDSPVEPDSPTLPPEPVRVERPKRRDSLPPWVETYLRPAKEVEEREREEIEGLGLGLGVGLDEFVAPVQEEFEEEKAGEDSFNVFTVPPSTTSEKSMAEHRDQVLEDEVELLVRWEEEEKAKQEDVACPVLAVDAATGVQQAEELLPKEPMLAVLGTQCDNSGFSIPPSNLPPVTFASSIPLPPSPPPSRPCTPLPLATSRLPPPPSESFESPPSPSPSNSSPSCPSTPLTTLGDSPSAHSSPPASALPPVQTQEDEGLFPGVDLDHQRRIAALVAMLW
ncbi:hypothetical protein JCM8547_003669 [Rhodosporidiobolus lusitaniae]